MRETSEHEDDCCVLLELLEDNNNTTDVAEQQRLSKIKSELEASFVEKANKRVSKGAKVRNFISFIS